MKELKKINKFFKDEKDRYSFKISRKIKKIKENEDIISRYKFFVNEKKVYRMYSKKNEKKEGINKPLSKEKKII